MAYKIPGLLSSMDKAVMCNCVGSQIVNKVCETIMEFTVTVTTWFSKQCLKGGKSVFLQDFQHQEES